MDAILERIAKLQELASRGGTPEEAEAAAAKVQALLLKHNLTLVDVEARSGLGEVKMVTLPAFDSIWRAKLLGVVAEAHLCRAVRSHGPDGRPVQFTILGHAHNLDVVQRVYDWLLDLIPQMAILAYERFVGPYAAGLEEVWLHSYRLGVIDGIHDAYQESRESLNDETGLVPIETDVEAALEAAFPERSEYRFGGKADKEAYLIGVKEGRAVKLDRQIEEAYPHDGECNS
jgi:hypothetical protein